MKTNLVLYKSINFRKCLVIITCLASVMLSSCEEWLDVSPNSEIKEDDLFSNEQGYKDALYGVYQKIAQSQLYGENLTLGFIDVLAQQYETTASAHMYFESGLFQYDNVEVESRIDNIWSTMYSAIAQINFILKDIDQNKDVFSSERIYNVLKGEAIGLRGMLHLDLVRMFGASPTTSVGEAAIPYMEEFSIKAEQRISIEDALVKCEADLLQAEELLSVFQEMDEIRNPSGALGDVDNFLAFRQNRLNYWAVKGMLARLYLYKGFKEDALDYATDVIDSEYFRFMTQSELNTTGALNDRTFTYEHVFSLNAVDLKTVSDNYFRISANTTAELYNKLVVSENRVEEIFEISSGYSSDPRYDKLWQYSQSVLMHAKLWQDEEMSTLISNLVPVLKISEMYYIAAECETNIETAVGYLNAVRTARFIPELPTNISSDVLDGEIFKEYRKEFISEGQLFYYYKRKNTLSIPNSQISPMTNKEYVLPLPLRELEFGNNN